MRTFWIVVFHFYLLGHVFGQGRFEFNGSRGRPGLDGEIVFDNYGPNVGIDAPVFDVDCQTRLVGPEFVSQVYAGLQPDALQALSRVVAFDSGPRAGYMLSGVDVIIPGAGNQQIVYAQLRAWDTRAGPTYEAALAAGGKYGFSNLVPMPAIIAPGPPFSPVGLESFCLIPEPPVLTLIASGVTAFLVSREYRRRRSRISMDPARGEHHVQRRGVEVRSSWNRLAGEELSRNCRTYLWLKTKKPHSPLRNRQLPHVSRQKTLHCSVGRLYLEYVGDSNQGSII